VRLHKLGKNNACHTVAYELPQRCFDVAQQDSQYADENQCCHTVAQPLPLRCHTVAVNARPQNKADYLSKG
jgi:hypothetical protein